MQMISARGSLIWAHIGDLHITGEQEQNYRDFLSIIESINTHLVGQIDFCVLPGDNADDGSSEQYVLIRRGLDQLQIPVHVIPGDHDRKPGDLSAFYRGLGAAPLPYAATVKGHRCIFLDIVSAGSGGPDFALGQEQVTWLEAELNASAAAALKSVVFMHAYPADLKADGEALRRLLQAHHVAFVDMGHTHYNELANDGSTIFATTRSTGQVEEGPVGFSLASLQNGVVSWRFKPLRTAWPLVMITSPADHRLVTDTEQPDQLVSGGFTVTARVLGSGAVSLCRCRIDEGPWAALTFREDSGLWQRTCQAPARQFRLGVEATDASGRSDTDTLVVAAPGYRPPQRRADGSDADAVGGWPERHLLATRLGPNRNGRQW